MGQMGTRPSQGLEGIFEDLLEEPSWNILATRSWWSRGPYYAEDQTELGGMEGPCSGRSSTVSPRLPEVPWDDGSGREAQEDYGGSGFTLLLFGSCRPHAWRKRSWHWHPPEVLHGCHGGPSQDTTRTPRSWRFRTTSGRRWSFGTSRSTRTGLRSGGAGRHLSWDGPRGSGRGCRDGSWRGCSGLEWEVEAAHQGPSRASGSEKHHHGRAGGIPKPAWCDEGGGEDLLQVQSDGNLGLGQQGSHRPWDSFPLEDLAGLLQAVGSVPDDDGRRWGPLEWTHWDGGPAGEEKGTTPDEGKRAGGEVLAWCGKTCRRREAAIPTQGLWGA